MQFHAAVPNETDATVAVLYGGSYIQDDGSLNHWIQGDRAADMPQPGSLGKAEWLLRPGELQSTRQRQLPQQDQGYSVAWSPTKRAAMDAASSRKLRAALDLTPEPINYLRLRRTEESKRASLRNRNAMASVVAQEILVPSAAPPPRVAASNPSTVPHELRMPHPSPPKALVAAPSPPLPQLNGRVDDVALTSTTQHLAREQEETQLEAHRATAKVHALLAELRASSGASLHKFTPLFKLYARRRLRSRWRVWRRYVAWHAQEQQRLQKLAPFAVHIQRVFRFRRHRWICRRERLEALYAQWEAARTLQHCVCKWLRRRQRMLLLTVTHATRLQASWRGRRARKQVKRELQTRLRSMLATLSPTGDLHRLHEVTRGDRALAAKVNAMLTLVTETHMAVEMSRGQQRAPKYAAIAARNVARPVKATRRQLFHAVHELRQLLMDRECMLQAATERFLEAKRIRREHKRDIHAAVLRKELARTTERLAEARGRDGMHRAELETREFVRSLRTMEEDVRLRRKLRLYRREQEECALMLVEEYQMRYVVAETHRRELAARDRLLEVFKREAFLQEREQQQLREMEAVIRADAEKKAEMESQRVAAHEEEKARWASLSKATKAEALERLEQRERREEGARRHLEDQQDAERAHARELEQQKEASRCQKHEEVERELREREAMMEADKRSRQWRFALKKTAAKDQWVAKREKERTKYSVDPLDFAKVQAQRALEEEQRRESYFMRREDALSTAVEEQERKQRYFQQCREKKRLRDIERRREVHELSLMEIEDQQELERMRSLRQAEEFKRQLREMQQLADQVDQRQKERLLEARNRKLMRDEETQQCRLQQSQLLLDRICEKHERQNMREEDRRVQLQDTLEARLQDKRLREKRNLRMMREDVASMERQDWEDEGARLEKLLWSPHEAAALRHLVVDYPSFLRLNVEVLMELADDMKGPPPFELDYDAVAAHLATEHTLREDAIPKKKRKPRRFFYHEYFEEDPILARIRRKNEKIPAPPTTGPGSTNSQTRERWKRVAVHFLGSSWSSEASRKGLLLMETQQYEPACSSLLEAVHGMQQQQEYALSPPSYQDVSPALLRQLGRCFLKRYEANAQWDLLRRSLFFFQQASTHVIFLSSPSFLQEIAFALEKSGDLRHSAEILGGIVTCFPRYPRLVEVIFRAGIVMFSLKMYRQSREYVLHAMEAAPFGWEPFDIMFLAARIMQLEGKPSRKLCAVAYEDAFRKNLKGALHRVYSTWQDWIKAPDTWREAGDRYFDRYEYGLASDAYQMMRKRQTHKPSHLTSKRKAVVDAVRRQQGQQGEQVSVDDGDWMRLSCTFAMLNDRSTTVVTLGKWLAEGGGYRERVLERFYRWPLVRWKLLTGANAPSKVTQWLDQQRKAQAERESRDRQHREAKRQELLRQRSERNHLVLQAWGQQDQVQEQQEQEQTQHTTLKEETVHEDIDVSMEGTALVDLAIEGYEDVSIT
ncbi:hypothetical protein BBJ28_00013647 [Nothophytophthora sp. Chile5]|nr:hypothetical protein BBJ28_00013647 [Nothophytophthora sp. Chile5]